MHWLFVPKNESSWAWCPTTDLNCYILPIGNCQPTYKHKDKLGKIYKDTASYKWLSEYLLRFRHELRWRIQNAIDQLVVVDRNNNNNNNNNNNHHATLLLNNNNCTAIHVRRGDTGLARPPFRRHAALSEYIEAGHIGHDELILILTDDVTTIQEAEQFYPDYNWIYMNRPRVNMSFGGFDGHVPSGDGGPPKSSPYLPK
jgi:hypothetical protein